MSDNPLKIKQFDTSLPDHVAFRRVRIAAGDLSIRMTGTRTANGFGLFHRVYNAADHLAMVGVVAAPIVDPGNYVAGDAAAIKNQERAISRYDAQEVNSPILTTTVLAALPERIVRLAEVNGSLRHHAHLHEILDEIELHLPFTEADVMSCRERVSGAYPRGAMIRPFVADQLAHLEYLADTGQEMSNMDAAKLMKSAYLSNRIDQTDFAPALTEYVQVHGALND